LSSPRGSNRIGEGGALWTLGDCMLNPEGFSSLSLRSAPLKGTPSPLHLLSPWWGKRKLEQITRSMLSEGCPGHLRDSPSFWWTVRCGSFINLNQLTFVSAVAMLVNWVTTSLGVTSSFHSTPGVPAFCQHCYLYRDTLQFLHFHHPMQQPFVVEMAAWHPCTQQTDPQLVHTWRF
jgi:hypothetical protein